jgi:D-alanine-D-alanine ligase
MPLTQSNTVAVLFGGNSTERDVSLRSAKSVGSALHEAGYTVRMIDTGPISENDLIAGLQDCAVVFPVLHGTGGEDGTAQQWLDDHGFKYIGTGFDGSNLCLDKNRYKQVVQKLGVQVPKGAVVTEESLRESALIHVPYVLKPNDGGSSVDTFIVRNPNTADLQAIHKAFDHYKHMLIEELIEGIEITVGVLDNEALPVIEIIPPADGEFDYENKYNGKTEELCPPQHVDPAVQKQAQEIARHIHEALGLRDISRTDMIVRKGDNQLYILETNTIPGMTDQSLFPKAASVAGYSMPIWVDRLVRNALAR